MDDDELETEAGVDEQTTFDAIIEAAVEHTRIENAALERDDTAAADDAHERRDAIIPTDPFELRDLLDTAIEYLAIEQEDNADLRDALKAAKITRVTRAISRPIRFIQGFTFGAGTIAIIVLASIVLR